MATIIKTEKLADKAGWANPNLMPTSNRLPHIEFDKLVLNLEVNSQECRFFEELQRLKERLQATEMEQQELVTFQNDQGREINFNLRRTGINFYPFVLSTGDITICLSSRPTSQNNLPQIKIEFGSVTCQNDLDGAYRAIKEWLRSIDIIPVFDSVSRVDLCVDLFDFSLNDADGFPTDIVDETRFITKATNTAFYKAHRQYQGFSVGKSKIMMRVYDKIKELSKPENSEKYTFFLAKWGQQAQEVLRVEFQLRRDAVKEFGILSYKDLVAKQHEIWRYLTTDWFRHASKPVDRKNRHQDRAEVSPFWDAVQKAVPSGSKRKRVTSVHRVKSMKQLLAQIRGLCVTIIAGNSVNSETGEVQIKEDDFEGVMDFASGIVRDEIRKAMEFKEDWERVYRKRVANTILNYDNFSSESTENPIISNLAAIKANQLYLEFGY